MLKNTLIMVVDDKAVCAYKRRLDDGATPDDYGCTNCWEAKYQWTYLFDLTQMGMWEDDVRTVVECPNCHAQFFFQYTVARYEVLGVDDRTDKNDK